jgi:hypothetical protein
VLGRVAITALVITGVSCNGDSAEPSALSSPTLKVAVSDIAGIDGILPSGQNAGAAAYLFELLYESAAEHFEIAERRGSRVLLRHRADSTRSTQELGRSLRYRGLQTTSVEGDLVTAEFHSQASADDFSVETAGVAVGPYQALEVNDRVQLRPRSEESLGAQLELVAADRDDHWRLLAGRHVDVAPQIRASHARFLTGVPSLRLISYPVRGSIALILNQRHGILARRPVRTAVASVIDPAAAARVVCGDVDCAVVDGALPPAAYEAHELPSELRLMAVSGSKDEQLTARVLAHQLWAGHQMRVVIELLEVKDLSQRLVTGDYDLILLPLPSDPAHLFQSFSGILDEGSERVETAIAAADWEGALEGLRADGVVVPLWNEQFYAAIDSSVCGARPDSATSWLWLADLHFCEDEAD